MYEIMVVEGLGFAAHDRQRAASVPAAADSATQGFLGTVLHQLRV